MAKQPTIYLDHAAATPVDKDVALAMAPYSTQEFYNPSAIYGPALKVRKDLDKARAQVAHWLGSRPSEIIFTAGGSEANNLAVHGVMRKFPNANIVTSSIEHDSVLAPASRYKYRSAKVNKDGRIDLVDLAKKIDKNTIVVSVMYANSEIGTIQPIRQIARLISDKRKDSSRQIPLFFHVDACQAVNYLDLHVARLGVDMMTINGGKIYGPKQSGVLYLKAGIELQPLVDGGGQERGLRSGTENVSGSIGLARALDIAQKTRHQESDRLKKLQARFIQSIESRIPNSQLNGSLKYRLPNNIHITFKGQDNERLLIQLDESGILAAAGSACGASSETASHVLKAIGLADVEARASIRFTMGRSTTQKMIDQTTATLATLLN